MRWLLRLYPRRWRDRYEAELLALVDDLPPSPAIAVDLIRGAGREHARSLARALTSSLRTAGGPPTSDPFGRHPTAWAMVAVVVLSPSLALVGVSLLAFQLAVPALAGLADPILAAIDGWLVANVVLLGGPVLAVLLAAIPMLRIALAHTEGELRLTVGFRPRVVNLAVLLVAALVGAILVGYLATELLLEPPRA
jgi:hypothetical protein